VEMNWAYDVMELTEAVKKNQEAIISRNQTKIVIRKLEAEGPPGETTERRKEQLTKELQKIEAVIVRQEDIIKRYKDPGQVQKVGTVFVSFQRVDIVNKIIEKYESSFVNSFMKTMFSWVKKSRLHLNHKYFISLHSVIMVSKAPAPREIIWQNLGFSYMRSFFFEVVFILVMVMMLFGALRIILWFMNYSLYFRIEAQAEGGKFLILAKGLVMSLLVVIINCLMRLVVPILSNIDSILHIRKTILFLYKIRRFIYTVLLVVLHHQLLLCGLHSA
jgi:hypothetical protein